MVTSHRPTLKQLMEEERLNEEEAKKQMLNDKDSEIGSKRGDKIGKLKACEMGMEHESLSYPNQRVPTIYTEAKKHLSEMLSNGDETKSLDQSNSFPESLSVDPNPNSKQEEEEDSKFKLQKKLPDSFPESLDEVEPLNVDPKQQQQQQDPKFKSQKNLPDSFPKSSDEIELLRMSDDPNPKQGEEEGEEGEEGEEEEDPKFKLLKKLPDSIFQKKLMELLDHTFFCL